MTTPDLQAPQPAPSPKHTPGPWEVTHTGNKDDFRGLRTWINAEGGTVAAVFPCGNPRRAFRDEELSDLPEPSDGPIGQSNARLLAAAPELLAVLERCSHINGFREFNDYLPTIRAAIAKATGAAT